MSDSDDLQMRLEVALVHLRFALSSNNIGLNMFMTHPRSGVPITSSELLAVSDDTFERMVKQLKLQFTESRQAKGEDSNGVGKRDPNPETPWLDFSFPWIAVENELQKIRNIRAEVPKRDSGRGNIETPRGLV